MRPATGESEAGGFQNEGVTGLHRQFMSSLRYLVRPSLKIQSKNNVEDIPKNKRKTTTTKKIEAYTCNPSTQRLVKEDWH